jgi:phytoene dehydrogenase-like protein
VILSNAALPNLVNSLVPALQDTDYQKQVNSMEIACSLFSLYLAFSESPTTLGNKHYSTIVSDIPTSLKEYIPNEKSDDYTKKGFVFVDYSVFDSQLSEAGYIGAICGIDYLENWEGLSENEYKKKKEAVKTILINRLDKLIPGIKNIVVCAEMATPRTIVRYTQNPGTVYGFAQTIEQTGSKIQSLRKPPIENLYCASAWTGMGGFSGAIMGGYSCALKILKDT